MNRKLDNCSKALTRVACEIKATTLTEEEFSKLMEDIEVLMSIIYQQRPEESKATTQRFNKALRMLRQIRK